MSETLNNTAAENTSPETEEINPLSMSDEEFDQVMLEMESPVEPKGTADDSEQIIDSTPAATDNGVPAGETGGEETLDNSTSGEELSGEAAGSSDESGSTESTTDSASDSDKQSSTPETVDYEAAYKKLTAPFKANGIDIQVRSIDEAITLMQMGANYHKKMATLKPALKIVRMLEKHNLNDEGKLQFLVDLSNKDPQAIHKFIKESGIDPVDINISEDANYVPKAQPVSDVEMQLEEVLESIQATPTFSRTINVVTKDWDLPSRKILADNPKFIAILNGQMQSGIFDKVASEVTRARALGHYQGVSDFEAYKHMGDIMDSKGLLAVDPVSTPVVTVPNKETTTDQQKEAERQARRKAAGSPPLTTPNAKNKPVKNILALSDEEFEKLPLSAFVVAEK